MRRKIVKIENIVIYTELSKLCYVIYNIIFLYTIFIMQQDNIYENKLNTKK